VDGPGNLYGELMSGFNSGIPLDTPVDESGAPYEFNLRVKTFEESSMAVLESTINSWITGLTETRPVIFPPVYLGTETGSVRVLVPYGYFTPPA